MGGRGQVIKLHRMAYRKWLKFPALEVKVQIKEGIHNVRRRLLA